MTQSNEADDWLQVYLAQQQQAQQEAQERLAGCCQQLAALGIEQVQIAYDGYGDEGSVQGITALVDHHPVPLDAGLEEALSDAACELLPGGWEINEGSFGELLLDVAKRRVTRQHNWRIESSEYEEEDFEL